jgi:hypothetical protein
VEQNCNNITLYGTVTAYLDFMNKVSARTDTLRDLKFQILETTFDVIVGRPEIQKYQLGARLCRYFGATPMSGQDLGAVAPANAGFGNGMCPCRNAIDFAAPSVTDSSGRGSFNQLCGPCELVDDTLHTLASPKSAAQSVCSGYRMHQHRTNVLATMVVPKGNYLDHIDDSKHIE